MTLYLAAAILAVALVFDENLALSLAGVTIRLVIFAVFIGGTVAFLNKDERAWLATAVGRVLRPVSKR